MNLEQLRAAGVIAANPLTRRTIKLRYRPLKPREQWADPAVEEREDFFQHGTAEYWLKKASAADMLLVMNAPGREVDKNYMLIHRCVFHENGDRVFPTVEDTLSLDLVMFADLLLKLKEINGDFPKASPPKTKPGTTSPSPSAENPLNSGSNVSAPKNGTAG